MASIHLERWERFGTTFRQKPGVKGWTPEGPPGEAGLKVHHWTMTAKTPQPRPPFEAGLNMGSRFQSAYCTPIPDRALGSHYVQMEARPKPQRVPDAFGEAAIAPRRWSSRTITRSEVRVLCYDVVHAGGAAVHAKSLHAERGRPRPQKARRLRSITGCRLDKGQSCQGWCQTPEGDGERLCWSRNEPQTPANFYCRLGSQRRRLIKSQVMRGHKKFTALLLFYSAARPSFRPHLLCPREASPNKDSHTLFKIIFIQEQNGSIYHSLPMQSRVTVHHSPYLQLK